MAEVLCIGAGIGGLCGAMLLALDGHDVTVLERDPQTPPDSEGEIWEGWRRRGVAQFRLPHFFQARFRQLLDRELPGVRPALEAAGCLRLNPIAVLPAAVSGGWRDGDDALDVITGRRPVVEAVLARLAQATPGVSIRRGVAVAGLTTADDAGGVRPVPHVNGVVTETGERIGADLVVDATGRRSPLGRWLEGIGAARFTELPEDCGFVYYARTLRSRDGSLPQVLGPLVMHHDSVTTLTLPGDNGTWMLILGVSAKDAALRPLRDVDVWTRAFGAYPPIAHWLDGEPIDAGRSVKVMAGIEDRYRRLICDGAPVVTGLVALADSWACTNPSVGRGASMALMHAVSLRDQLRRVPVDDPVAFALAWDSTTEAELTPWYQETLRGDRHRLAEIDASIAGRPYRPDDPGYELVRAFGFAAQQDPEVLRALLLNGMLFALLSDVTARVGTDRILGLGADWRDAPPMGPRRHELLKILGL